MDKSEQMFEDLGYCLYIDDTLNNRYVYSNVVNDSEEHYSEIQLTIHEGGYYKQFLNDYVTADMNIKLEEHKAIHQKYLEINKL